MIKLDRRVGQKKSSASPFTVKPLAWGSTDGTVVELHLCHWCSCSSGSSSGSKSFWLLLLLLVIESGLTRAKKLRTKLARWLHWSHHIEEPSSVQHLAKFFFIPKVNNNLLHLTRAREVWELLLLLHVRFSLSSLCLCVCPSTVKSLQLVPCTWHGFREKLRERAIEFKRSTITISSSLLLLLQFRC